MVSWMSLAHAEETNVMSTDDYAYALAIKGGISLGSYESGMNWFFIEQLKRNNKKLNVIAGASAGGINAVISAIQFCKESTLPKKSNLSFVGNLFFDAWNVDAYTLLPELSKNNVTEPKPSFLMKELGMDDTYSVFHREALMGALKHIRDAMEGNNFRENCVTHIALPITILQDYDHTANNDKNAIVTLRYAVPLKVSVDSKSKTLQFYNMKKGDALFQAIDDFLYLKTDKQNKIGFNEVLKLALASSAFPIAFSPIQLNTCIPNKLGRCVSTDYKVRTFIDGGSMDNAPIGLAKRISDYINQDTYAKVTKVVYINPAHKTARLQSWMDDAYSSTGDVTISGLQNYYLFLGKLLNYGMNAEYARSLRKDGKPLMPRRHYMLTADHLMHFGAFMHEDFRKFDFLVGVYDAVKAYDLYKKSLEKQSLNNDALTPWNNLLTINDNNIKDLFNAFDTMYGKNNTILFCKNRKFPFFKSDKRKNNNYLSIAYALCESAKNDSSNKSLFESFDQFKTSLSQNMQDQVEKKYSDFGVFRLQEILTSKQLTIEKARQAMMVKYLKDTKTANGKANTPSSGWLAQQKNITQYVAMASLMSKTMSYREKRNTWPRNTASSPYWKYLPDELGIDGLNSVPYISYHTDILFNQKQSSPVSIALSLDPYHWGRDNRKTSPYTGFTVAARYHKNSIGFSSLSAGIANYYNWKPIMAAGRKWDHGLYMGAGFFADKIHLSIIQRETLHSIKKTRFTFLIGIRDIGGLSELFMGY